MKISKDIYDKLYDLPGGDLLSVIDHSTNEVYVFEKDESYQCYEKMLENGIADGMSEEAAMEPDFDNIVTIYYYRNMEEYNDGKGRAYASTDDVHVDDMEWDLGRNTFYTQADEERFHPPYERYFNASEFIISDNSSDEYADQHFTFQIGTYGDKPIFFDVSAYRDDNGEIVVYNDDSTIQNNDEKNYAYIPGEEEQFIKLEPGRMETIKDIAKQLAEKNYREYDAERDRE